MPEGPEWRVDTEGNLSPPGEPLAPGTDEFGRDDPDTLERERRRRERQQRRAKSKKPKKPKKRGRQASPGQPAPTPAAARPAARPARPEKPRRSLPRKPAEGRAAPRQSAGARPSRRGPYGRRRILALAILLVGALLVWFIIAFFQPPPFDPGEGSGTVAVTIPEGATADEIAKILTENEVVSNGTLFKWRLSLAGKSSGVQASRYVLARNMSYGAAIDRLTGGGGKLTFTIPEGEDRFQIGPQAAELGIQGDYLAATRSFPGFDPNKYGAKSPKSLEGFLFPATYDLPPRADVNALVGEQLAAFKQNVAGVDMSFAKSKNLTVYDVLTIASMIDKEVQVDSERPLVAEVIYNRLSRGQPLGIDATTRYQFHNYTGEITQSQLASPSPYNTRTQAGLPPTPIGNPGLDAIKAAARPARGSYLFYVLNGDNSGRHCFASTEAEFEKLNAAYQSGQPTPNCRS